MNLAEKIEQVQKTKESQHRQNFDFHPIFEMGLDGEPQVVLTGVVEETKEKTFLRVLHLWTVLEMSDLLFVSDAHMTKLSTEGKDEEALKATVNAIVNSDDFVMPSEDPNAVDAMVMIEWKNGELIESGLMEYHINDDGEIEWSEFRSYTASSVDLESWMARFVDIAWSHRDEFFEEFTIPSPRVAFLQDFVDDGVEVMTTGFIKDEVEAYTQGNQE